MLYGIAFTIVHYLIVVFFGALPALLSPIAGDRSPNKSWLVIDQVERILAFPCEFLTPWVNSRFQSGLGDIIVGLLPIANSCIWGINLVLIIGSLIEWRQSKRRR